jgi:RAD50-interacting protein 1
VDPIAAFITALLPVLREKVSSLLKEISNDPGLLSRFMYQLFEFDGTIRNKFNYDAGNVQLGWKGITWEVLDTYFDRWLQVEKDFALGRYQEIIKSPDSIDFESTSQGKTKYTSVVAQVTDLLITVTKSYNHIRRFRNKMYFLIEIQAEILDQYHGRLSDSLDVYQTIMSPLGRRLHGVSKEMRAEAEGVAGLESLCKVYGSAEHIIAALNEWSNEEVSYLLQPSTCPN